MSGLRAGAARASMTPRREDLTGGIYLGGFGGYRQRRAIGIHDEPLCRAIAIGDDDSAFVVAALDLVGASGPLLQSIREHATRLTGLPASRIVIACTHSHASPDMQGLWGGTSQTYERYVAERAASAIREAFEAMAPATARAATASLRGVVRNRRGWPDTDDALTTLRFATAGGTPIATLVNYACHPTASGPANTEVSRDWCGYAADAVEAALGGVAVYVNGALGDVNPAADGAFEHAASLGDAVARAAVASLDASDEIGGGINVRTEPLLLPVQFERLSERVQTAVGRAGPALSVLSKAGGMHAAAIALHAAGRSDLAQMVAALEGFTQRKLVQRDGRTFLPTHCGYLRIGGDVEGVAAPGEVLSRLSGPLRATLGARHRLFFGLTHDTLGYFVPEAEWMTGRNDNYEESVSMGKHAAAVLVEALSAARNA